MLDLEPLQDKDEHYWTHEDDEEDESTVRDMLEEEAFKQRLYCEGAYVEEIIDD